MKTPDSEPGGPDDAWDDLFRQRLTNYTDLPPAQALHRILADANPPRPLLQRRWVPVSIVVLLLLGVGGLLVRSFRPAPEPVAGTGRLTTSIPQSGLIAGKIPVDKVPSPGAAPESDAVEDGLARPTEPGRREEPLVDRNREPDRSIRPAPLVASARDTRAGNQRQLSKNPPGGRGVETNPAEVPGEISGRNTGRRSDAYARSDRAFRVRTERVGTRRLVGPVLPEPATLDKVTVDKVTADAPIRAGEDVATTVAVPLQSPLRLPDVDFLAARSFRALSPAVHLPDVVAPSGTVVPQASRFERRPVWFASLTPLYNYQQISPIQTDTELVSDVRGARSLASDRLGGRGQLGLEWSLTGRLSLRTSVVYQQVRQSLRYVVRSARPDSVQVTVVDNQSVRLTPVFARQNYTETTLWHYVGASADLVWQLNRQTAPWGRHYVTVGTTLGRYTTGGDALNGLVQAAYGLERPLTMHLHLRIEPTIQVGWQSLPNRTNRFQSLPYSYGLALGLRFR